MRVNICDGNKYKYGKGYILLPLEIRGIPETFTIDDTTLHRKSSFHTSLVCVKNITSNEKEISEIIRSFYEFVSKSEIEFVRITNQFRMAEFEERKTIIAMCEVSNLENFAESIFKELNIKIPKQPTHITLYTLQPDAGIGLNNQEELEEKSKIIPTPESLKSLSVT